MGKYNDLLITDGDITLNPSGVPVMTCERDSIAQDLVHAIVESGLAVEQVGQRSKNARRTSSIRITLLVESDQRIIPGTAIMQEYLPGQHSLIAQTMEYGDINFKITSSKGAA